MKIPKTLGLATAMALALVALAGAASASAAVFKSESVNTTVTGTSTKSTALTLNGEAFTCGGANFSGWGLKTGSASSLESYSWSPGCVFIGEKVFWNTKSCVNKINAAAGESMQGTMDISNCETTMWYSRAETECRIEIPNQKGLSGVEFVNEGSGAARTVKVIMAIKNLTFTRTGSGCFGKPGTFTNGEYSGQWSISGSAPVGQVGVWVDQKPKAPTHFGVEGTPSVSGQLVGAASNGFNLPNAGSFSCKKFSVGGETHVSAPESLTLWPSYGECKFGSVAASVSMGNCSYTYHATGAVDIVGGSSCASKPITMEAGEGIECTVTIGPQSGLPGINYAVAGSGSSRSITSNGQATGLTYTATGVGCLEQGTFNNGLLGLSSYTLKLTASWGGLWLE